MNHTIPEKNHTVYYDINCPFCFILSEWADVQGLNSEFEWIGIEHAPYLDKQNVKHKKELDMLRDEVNAALKRVEGVHLKIPPYRPNSLIPLSILEYIRVHSPFNFYLAKRELSRALWQKGLDIGEKTVIYQILEPFLSLDISKINIDLEKDAVTRKTKAWRMKGYDRIPMIVASTGAEYLGLGNKKLLEAYFLSGLVENKDKNICTAEPVSGFEKNNSKNSENFQTKSSSLPLLRKIIEQTSDGILLVDENLTVLVCNKSALQINQLEYSDCIGFHLEKFVGKKAYKELEKAIIKKESSKATILLGKQMLRYFEIYIHYFSEQNAQYYTLSIRDINSRLENEASLKKQKERILQQKELLERKQKFMEHLLSSLKDIIIVTNKEGIVSFVNYRVLETLKYEKRDLIGLSISKIFKDEKFFKNEIINLLKNENNLQEEEVSVIAKNSKLVPCLLSGFVTNSVFEGSLSIIFILRDCSESRLLKKLQEKQLQLQEAHKLEAIGMLAGGIAHDFNNLLSIISGSANLLSRSDIKQEIKEKKLGAIMDASNRMHNMIKSLLSFGKRQTQSLVKINISDNLDENISMMKHILKNNCQLKLGSVDSNLFIEFDVSEFNQIIMNLIINARDAIGDRHGIIELSVYPKDLDHSLKVNTGKLLPGSYACISVRDNGSGIKDSVISNIFQPFFTTKAVGKGTGLGLATINRVVKKARGEIQIKTQVAKGTDFIIYLPKS